MDNVIQKISLFCKEGNSDKEYNLQIVEASGGYVVNFQYGRRGSALKDGTKTPSPVPLDDAKKIYEKIFAEKVGKGYKPGATTGGSYVSAVPAGMPQPKETLFIPQLLNSIEESEIETYLKDDRFGCQEKKDGRHQSIHKKAGKILVTNKKGQAIGYPEFIEKALLTDLNTLIDAEAIGESFHVFDLLEAKGSDLRGLGYGERHKALKNLFTSNVLGKGFVLVPLAIGYKAKKALYDHLKKEGREGIVFKRLDAPYNPGRPSSGGDMLKCKFYGELSARVAKGREGKRSVGLELLDGDKWVFMGNVTIPPNKEIPSIGSVIEVRYLYALTGGHLFQPFYKEPRDDVDASECLMKQVKFKAEED